MPFDDDMSRNQLYHMNASALLVHLGHLLFCTMAADALQASKRKMLEAGSSRA